MAFLQPIALGGYAIEPAKHGGFIVYGPTEPSQMRDIVFAGRLDACLEFLRRKLGLHDAMPVPGLQAVIFDLRTAEGQEGAKRFADTFGKASETLPVPEAAQFAWEQARSRA